MGARSGVNYRQFMAYVVVCEEATCSTPVIDAPFGKVGIRTEGEAVREIVYLPESMQNVAPDTPLAQRAVEQIGRYFAEPSAKFDLPLATAGTAFRRACVQRAARDSARRGASRMGNWQGSSAACRARSGRRAAIVFLS